MCKTMRRKQQSSNGGIRGRDAAGDGLLLLYDATSRARDRYLARMHPVVDQPCRFNTYPSSFFLSVSFDHLSSSSSMLSRI